MLRIISRALFVRGLRFAVAGSLAAVIVVGLLFSVVEGPAVDPYDGVWWAFTTVSTVGYGDVIPRTGLGRALGLLLMILGVGFLFVFAGTLVERFIAREMREDLAGIEKPEREILRRLEEIDARLARLERSLLESDPDGGDGVET